MKCTNCENNLNLHSGDYEGAVVATCSECGAKYEGSMNLSSSSHPSNPTPAKVIIDMDGCDCLDVYQLTKDRVWKKYHSIDLWQDGKNRANWPFIVKVVATHKAG